MPHCLSSFHVYLRPCACFFFVRIPAFGGGHSPNAHRTCFWEDFTQFIIKNYFPKLCAVFSIWKHMCSNATDREKKKKKHVWKEAALWTGSGWDGWQRWCSIPRKSWKRPPLAEQAQRDLRGPVWQRLSWWRQEEGGELTQVILSDRLHLSGSLTMTKCCTLSEYANTHHPEAVASALTEQLSIVIVYNFDFEKKSDVRLKCNSHLLPPTSSGPDNDSPPSPTALLPCTPPPFSTDPSNYIARLCTGRWPHCTSLRSDYVFTASRSRRWGIWVILSVGPERNGAIPQNWRLMWTDLASGAIRSYLAGESFAEPQFLLRRTPKSKTAWANVQESGCLII